MKQRSQLLQIVRRGLSKAGPKKRGFLEQLSNFQLRRLNSSLLGLNRSESPGRGKSGFISNTECLFSEKQTAYVFRTSMFYKIKH